MEGGPPDVRYERAISIPNPLSCGSEEDPSSCLLKLPDEGAAVGSSWFQQLAPNTNTEDRKWDVTLGRHAMAYSGLEAWTSGNHDGTRMIR